MKNYETNLESYHMYVDANNLYGWTISKKLPVNAFEWQKKYIEIWWKVYKKKHDKNSNKGYIVEVDMSILKIYMIYIMIYHFSQKDSKLINVIK